MPQRYDSGKSVVVENLWWWKPQMALRYIQQWLSIPLFIFQSVHIMPSVYAHSI